jgi:sugar phosphate permease
MIHVESARPTSIRWQVFALACAASFLLNLHRYTWNIVGPSLKDALRLTNTEVGFLFSLFYYTYAAGQIPSGVVIDRLGPHRVLSVSIITWSLALGLTGQTSVLWLPALCRLAFGLGQAGCYPSLAKVTRSWFPLNRRTAMQGWIATAFGRGGGALSPILLATVLMGTCGFSWQTSLLILALIGIGFAAVFWWFFRNTPAEHPATNQAERQLIELGSTPTSVQAQGLLPARRVARNRSVWFFALQQFLDAGSDVAFVSLIGSYFLQARGYDMSKTGWLASLPLWGGAVGGILGGWLNDRLIAATGNRRWSRSGIGFVGKALGCVALACVIFQRDGLTAAALMMASKFFSDWSQPTMWGTCTDMGGRFSATLFGIINTAGTLGGVVMPLVFGGVLDAFTARSGEGAQVVTTTNWEPLFVVLSVMYFGSGLCWLMVDCTRTLDDARSERAGS